MSRLSTLERQAVALLRSYQGQDVELAYSGGKDSEVCRYLCELAGIRYTAIHKNTTIDRPGTLAWVAQHGAIILRPQESFLQLVARKGMPTRRARFCCEKLKEYKVKDVAVIGVRQAESRARAARYPEPTMCRMYPHGQRVEQVLPLHAWTNEDVAEYIAANRIQLHPHYYDDSGRLQLGRRLGCMGCPLQGDRGKSDFARYPKLLRAIVRNLHKWESLERTRPLRSLEMFGSIYGLLYNDLFCRDVATFARKTAALGCTHRQYLEDYFGVSLP